MPGFEITHNIVGHGEETDGHTYEGYGESVVDIINSALSFYVDQDLYITHISEWKETG